MIYPDDANDFSGIMDITWQSLGRNPPNKETKKYWFSKLQAYSLGEVGAVFDKWIVDNDELPTLDVLLSSLRWKPEFHLRLATPKMSKEKIQENLQRMHAVLKKGKSDAE